MEELNELQQGYYHLKEHKFSEAKALFEKVNAEKEDAAAYIGILLAESGMQNENQLSELPLPLASYGVYRKAYACAGRGYRNTLDDIEKKQKDILARKERKYQSLLRDVRDEKKSEEEYESLISRAAELKDYGDARSLREELQNELDAMKAEKAAKKKKRRKITLPIVVIVVLALVVAALIFCFPKRGDVRYALTVHGYVTAGADSDIIEAVIEKEIHGIEVTGIGGKSFKDCAALTDVVLHEGITEIGKSAFNGCRELKWVEKADSVKSVGGKAFKDCKALHSLILAEGCTVKDNSFDECSDQLIVVAGNTTIDLDKE